MKNFHIWQMAKFDLVAKIILARRHNLGATFPTWVSINTVRVHGEVQATCSMLQEASLGGFLEGLYGGWRVRTFIYGSR